METPHGSTSNNISLSTENSQVPSESNAQPNNTSQDEVQDEPQDDDVVMVGGKRKLRSPAWSHFERVVVNGVVKAECKYCFRKLGGDSKNGTKHLLQHFDRCPKRPYRDIRQHILVKEEKKVDGGSTFLSNYAFVEATSRRNLAEMIILHEYPLSMVEHHGFRKFVGSLQPLFKVPTRNTIKSDILKIYDYEKEKTMKLLKKNKSRIAITTDMWTANYQKKGFMAITTHFIDQNWNLQSRILSFIYVPCPHTADVLANVLHDCLCDWNLDRKLLTITVDNCSTNDAIIDELLDKKLTLSSLIMNGQLFHMRCCAHILNLIVQDGLAIIGDGIERIRDSVAFWTGTPKREQRFYEAAHQLEIDSTKKLALDCKTRWNSTYLMLSTAIVYKGVFSRLKTREPKYKSVPTENDWEIAKDICDRLQLFYEVTVMFSGSKYPTANVFFPSVCEIAYNLRNWADSPVEKIKKMAGQMIVKFEKYWLVIHGVVAIAAVLDPRYKLKFVELLLPLLYGEEKAKIEAQKLKEFVKSIYKEYEASAPSEKNEYKGSSSLDTEPTPGHRAGFKKLFSEIATKASEQEDSESTTELDNYLKEPRLPEATELDLLMWWKTNGFKYPTLQRIAKDLLAVPVSTVASESAFSTSGRLISPHRSRLHPETLKALMCAQSWLLNEIRATCSNETEAYCRTIEYDYDVEEERANESGISMDYSF